MLGEPHDLMSEFPEFRDRIETLRSNDGNFARLMTEYDQLDARIRRIEEFGQRIADQTMEELKKRQRDLYLDIDRRLLQLERRSGGGGSAIAPAPMQAPPMSQMSTPSTTATVATSEPEQIDDGQDTTAVASGANAEQEQVAYQKAFDLLRALRYDQATKAFRQFLVDYPNGRYAHIAQYWLAEASYHTREYQTAIQDYQALIDKYPKSPKRAQALLKIGYSHFELKDFAKVFSTQPLSAQQLLLCLLVSSVVFVAIEVYKWVLRRRG